eukprot:TRINITY_DN1263_c0_g1_i2.p1 TRINITY_DN1263_c0_g1~~TRINITY_DN1263_c0_g1_i2.p1  ORF type:complete len:290 (-),score=44.02 TRINITY_DN1263_c0_g1_i2:3-872(-)
MKIQTIILLSILLLVSSSELSSRVFTLPPALLNSLNDELSPDHTQTIQSIDPSLPKYFDGREVWPACVGLKHVLNQGACGSCWSFAASEMLSDRFCIQSNGTVNVILSPQDLLSCESLNLGCTLGSLPSWACSFLVKHGISTIDCNAYVSGNGHVPACPKTCDDGSAIKYYKGKSYKHVGHFFNPEKHVEEIMRAVMEGPVTATFWVYEDFSHYDGGVYVHKSGSLEGLHSVKIIGFGEDIGVHNETIPYWLAQNSWGRWGPLKGYFKILRGSNECGFERLVYSIEPEL